MNTRPRRSRQRGAATLVEAAFTIPILLIFVLGVMDFSRAMYAYHFVSSVASDAARFASVRGTACKNWSTQCPANTNGSDVAAYVQTLEPGGLNFNNPPNHTTACTGSSSAGCISVISSYPRQTGGWPSGCSATGPINNPGCPVSVTVTYTFGFVFQTHFSIAKLAFPSTAEMVISR